MKSPFSTNNCVYFAAFGEQRKYFCLIIHALDIVNTMNVSDR
ncbi:hypothetical protein GMES_0648 [Paraglaciecola mesophila KMM 241]|uniref:Uncharacterized protein n=1 Tax=Paraglaciecola mesophila KMM 241 TaxID=1128912 RepID=K6XQQ2_9ALTE|nr:hypothetical protein GMES_0648 [Paraglaciecola mesophila KMM 241]